ncbi:hypothetical protein Tco_1322390 [Tanacetum coccineum]
MTRIKPWVKLSGGPNRLMLKNHDDLWLWVKSTRTQTSWVLPGICVEAQQLTDSRGQARSLSLEAATLEKECVKAPSDRDASCAADDELKRSAEAVGCKNTSVGERSALE